MYTDRRVISSSLYDLHVAGATLIIEHLGFRRVGGAWLRDEVHSVVGHPPERWTLLCADEHDHSDIKGPPRDEDRDCDLCDQHHIHTLALHRARRRLVL